MRTHWGACVRVIKVHKVPLEFAYLSVEGSSSKGWTRHAQLLDRSRSKLTVSAAREVEGLFILHFTMDIERRSSQTAGRNHHWLPG
jgi:hypothetical protein